MIHQQGLAFVFYGRLFFDANEFDELDMSKQDDGFALYDFAPYSLAGDIGQIEEAIPFHALNDQFLTDAAEAGVTFAGEIDFNSALTTVDQAGKIKISNRCDFRIPVIPDKDGIVLVITNKLKIALGKRFDQGFFYFFWEYHYCENK
jgi:hypothetical protein